MEKYYIIPNSIEPVDEIEAESPEDAMVEFAWQMDSNMNTYFKAVAKPEDEDEDEEDEENKTTHSVNINYSIDDDFCQTQFDTWDENDLAELWWYYCKENNLIQVEKIIADWASGSTIEWIGYL